MKRKFTVRLFLAVLTILGVIGGLLVPYIIQVVEGGPKFTVELHKVQGLRRGTPLLSWPDLIPLGRIEEIKIDPEHLSASAVVALEKNSRVAHKVKNAENTFFAYHFNTSENYLKISAAERLLAGPALVVMFASGDGQQSDFFKISEMPLPFEGIDFQSKEITVNFKRNLHQLEPGARVLNEKGLLIGQVRKLIELANGSVDVLIVLKHNSEAEEYLASDTRFYLDRAEITPEGLKGSGETFFFGPRIVAYLNRSDSRTLESAKYFYGYASAPPTHISTEGEKSLVLESTFELSSDTNLVFQGSSIGYVHSCKAAIDNSSFFSEIRVYPGWHNLITQDSKFSLERKLKLQLFERTPEGIFDSFKALRPEAVIPDPKALVRPSIEVFVPPFANKAYNFGLAYEEKEKNSFFLHKEPHDDWLKWRVSRSSEVLQDETKKLPYPNVYQVRMQWKNKGWGSEPTDYSGYATLTEKGLVGFKNYMFPQVDLKYVDKPTFTIEGKLNPFTGEAQIFGNMLMTRQVRIEGGNPWNLEQRVKLENSEDMYFIPPGMEPRIIDSRRLQKTHNGFKIKPEAITYDQSWNGLPVMVLNGAEQYKMVGILFVTGDPNNPYMILEIDP